jgi:hypothetical protein
MYAGSNEWVRAYPTWVVQRAVSERRGSSRVAELRASDFEGGDLRRAARTRPVSAMSPPVEG